MHDEAGPNYGLLNAARLAEAVARTVLNVSESARCNARMNDKPTNESIAAIKVEIDELIQVIDAKLSRLETQGAKAAQTRFVDAGKPATSQDSSGREAVRELTAIQRLEELKKLGLPLKPQHADRRDEALSEVAKLDGHVETERVWDRTWESVKEIHGWSTDGVIYETVMKAASAFDSLPLHVSFNTIQSLLAAEERPSTSKIAEHVRAAADLVRAEAERALKNREDEAAMMRESRQRNPKKWPWPQRKLPHEARFAELVLELNEKYFKIPTGLVVDRVVVDGEEIERKTGPIVALAEAFARIWGVPAPSGNVISKAKTRMKRRAARRNRGEPL
jgi:hypothetical protein